MLAEAPASQFLDVRGVRIRLREKGNGPPLLLFHGAGGPGPWRPYQEALAQQFRLLAPDHPGFGESDRPDWVETIDDLVYHYLDFLDLLHLQRVDVVGHSLGGWIAAELAVAHPEVVDRLVLVDPAGLRRLDVPVPDLFALSEEESTRLVFYDQSLAEAELSKEQSSEAIYERIKNLTTFARLSWNPYLYNPKLAHQLYRLSAPTLVIWGRHDRVIPIENADLWRQGIPHAELRVIEDCGHGPHRERPDQFVQAVTDFLQGESRGGGAPSGGGLGVSPRARSFSPSPSEGRGPGGGVA